jgi:DNA-binding winged helix-turn-helix (wHTH) protein
MSKPTSHFYEFGPFRIDTVKRLLLQDGEVDPLTPKAFDTLLALVENNGRVIEKDELMKEVWADTIVEEGGLARNISVLRKGLGERPDDHQYIVTVRGRGYRFVAPVRELEYKGISRAVTATRFIFPLLILVVQTLPCCGQSAVLRDDAAHPVERFTSDPSRVRGVQFFSFEFQRPYFGREGPNFTRLDGQPSAGAQYLVKADLFRQEVAATAKFELVDIGGRVIQLLPMSKSDNSLDHGEYAGFVKVPSQPFRVAVSGRDLHGKRYRRLFARLFRPMNRPPAPPLLPPLPKAEVTKIAAMLKAFEQQAIANMEKQISKHPDGVIVMPRVEVSNVTYEPFVSEKDNRLGMRLRYDLRFSVDGDYAHDLNVFPFYKDANVRGLVEMEVINEKIDPRPEPPSYATPDIHVDLNTLVRYGSEAWFKNAVVYHFSVDLAPNFVGQNASKTKFCVYEDQFKNSVESQRRWEAMKANPAPVKYRIFINKMDWGGETKPFYPPKIFYDGFLREGAVKCKPYKNVDF